ncbi:MAG: hypothetical protein ABIG34_00140 [Candidatus Peregrinibacteria bacterium]
MKSSLKLFGLLVVVLSLSFTKRGDAQTVEQLNAQANWQIALSNLATAAGKNSIRVQMVEAEAKLIAAQATMVTAKAGANKTNAEALQALEQARSLELDNSLKKAVTFYEKRARHDAYMALAKPQKTLTPEYLLRRNEAATPMRLTKLQIDSARGIINWPPLLLGENFSDVRIQLDELYVSHLDYPNGSLEAKTLTTNMSAKLRSMVRKVPGYEYANAKNFIRGLELEFQPKRQEPGQTQRAGVNQLASFER